MAGYVYLASSNLDTFTNALDSDMIITTGTSSQNILLGTQSNIGSIVTITSNRVGIAKSNPSELLHVAQGNARFESNVYILGALGANTAVPTEALSVQGNIKASSNMYVMNVIGVGKSNTTNAYGIDVLGNVNITGNYSVNGNPILTSNSLFNTFSVAKAFRKTFTASNEDSNVTLTITGNYNTSPLDMEVYQNGAKLAYVESNLKDYDVSVVNSGGTTTFNVTFETVWSIGDIIDVAIWPSYSNMYGINAFINTSNISSNLYSSNIYAVNTLGVGVSNPLYPLHVVGNAAIKGNLAIENTLSLKGIALQKRDGTLANITVVNIPGYSNTSNGVFINTSNFIAFANSNGNEFSRYSAQGFLGLATTSPTALLDIRNFGRHPTEGLVWTSSNSLTNLYTAPLDTNSNLLVRIISSSASNATLLPAAFSASNDVFISSNNVYNATGDPNNSIQTLVSGSNYSGEWVEVDLPNMIIANRIYINANASTFTVAGSSNNGSTFGLLFYTNSNVPGTYAYYDVNNTAAYDVYRLIVNKTTTNNSNIVVTTFKVYGSAQSNPTISLDNRSFTLSNGTTTVNGNLLVNTDTINYANSNSPIEFPPAAMTTVTTSLSGQRYGNGSYVSSSSSSIVGREAWKLFNKTASPTDMWTALNETYSSSVGIYTGAESTVLVNGSNITGEWVQIQLPQSIILNSVSITSTQGTFTQNSTTYSFAQVRSPNAFSILGSENGSNWSLVYSATNVNNWLSAGGETKTFSVFSPLTAYKYYRLIVQSIGQVFIGAAGNYYAEFSEWRLFGALPPALLSIEKGIIVNNNIGVYNNDPRFALDIAGDLNFTGTLRQSGAPYVGSQWSNNSTNVFLLGSNVGIGVSTPDSRLHLTSNAPSSLATLLTLQNIGAGNLTAAAALDFKTYATNFAQARIHCLDQNFSGHIIFSTKVPGADGNALSERFRITHDGNIGIGLSNPSYRLHVTSNIMIQGNFSASNYLTHGRLYINDANFGMGCGTFTTAGVSDNLYIWAYGSSGRDIAFCHTLNGLSDPKTWNLDMIIKGGTGNVGIGTSNPGSLLAVAGGATVGSSYSNIEAPTNGIIVQGNVGIGTLNPGSTLEVQGRVNFCTSTRYAAVQNYMTTGSLTIGGQADYGGGTTGWISNTAGFMMECDNYTEMMVHDYGTRCASFMRYDGPNNTFIIGRGNTGFGGAQAVSIPGTLSKGGGSFDIEHPDPVKKEQGYRLRHCFVEAPTRGDNIYRYVVQTSNKQGTISLPDYFKHLNENAQVWVSAKSVLGYGKGVVREDLTAADIVVSEDGEYNVLIIGTRKDQLMVDFFDSKGVEYISPSS